jgi:hypothetical protein
MAQSYWVTHAIQLWIRSHSIAVDRIAWLEFGLLVLDGHVRASGSLIYREENMSNLHMWEKLIAGN